MEDPSNESEHLPLKLDYGRPSAERRMTFGVFFTIGAGFVLGLFAVGCVGSAVFGAAPPQSSLWARWIVTGLFAIVGFGSLALSLLLLRWQWTKPMELGDPFFAGFLMGAALSFLMAGACYVAA